MLPRLMRILRLMLVAALLVAPAGCGTSSAGTRRLRDATLILDFTPNAVHAGIYAAVANRYDRAEGLRLHVIVPSASTDSIKLLESGRVNFAILDLHDLAIARARGAQLVGIMAIVQRPLAAVIAAAGVRNPRQLEGKLVGITGVPSDTAVLRSTVAGAGGDPHRLRTITIGFNAVAALLARRVAAATAFWNDEGVTLEHRRPGFHIFRVDQYGAPRYPELVLCTTAQTLHTQPQLVAAAVRTLVRGYRFAVAHPGAAAAQLEAGVAGLDPTLVAQQLAVLVSAFTAPDGRVGELSPAVLHAWARWELEFGVVSRLPDVGAMFDGALVR